MNVLISVEPNGSVTYKRILVDTSETIDAFEADEDDPYNSDLQEDEGEPERVICDICGHAFEKKVGIFAHKRTCGKTWQEKQGLLNERKEKTDAKKTCPHCSHKFDSKRECEAHLEEVLVQNDQPCPIGCGKIFCKDTPLKDHLRRKAFLRHVNECRNKFAKICLHCKKSFKTTDQYQSHLEQLLETPEPCPLECGRIFTKENYSNMVVCRNAFILHIDQCQKMKVEEKKTCSLCGKEFVSSKYKNLDSFKTSYFIHKKRCKGQKESNDCRVCYKSFKFPSELKRHMCRGPNDNMTCPKCCKVFKHPSRLQNHLAVCLACNVCQRVFKTERSLLNHPCGHATMGKPVELPEEVDETSSDMLKSDDEEYASRVKMEVEEEEDEEEEEKGALKMEVNPDIPVWIEEDEDDKDYDPLAAE